MKNIKLLLIISTMSFSIFCVTSKESQNLKLADAIDKNSLPDVKTALKNGADINNLDLDLSPLMIAATTKEYIPLARYLLKNGAKINLQNKNGWTALINAAFNSADMAEFLLKHGANPNLTSQGTSPLMVATYSVDLVNSLLKHGANPNLTDNEGNTALIYAVEGTKEGSAQEKENRTRAAESLLNHGAKVNITNNNGDTALSLAKPNKVLFYKLQAAATKELTDKGKINKINVLNLLPRVQP